jgi:hypothetical protein
MVAVPLLAASLADVLMGALFAYAGRTIAQRKVGVEARRAARGFSTWWYAIGFLVGVEGARGIVASYGLLSISAVTTAFLVIWYVWVIVLSAAMWGLLVYVAYLYRGTRTIAAPLAFFYSAWAAIAIWQTARAGPMFVPSEFVTLVVYETPLASWVEIAFFAFLYLPQLVGIALYLGLFRRVTTRPARARLLAIGLGLAVWLGANLVAGVLDLIETSEWQVAKRVLGLAVSIVILASYGPPAPAGPPPSRGEIRSRSEAMGARLRELI